MSNTTQPRVERRSRTLTDEDLDEIWRRLDASFTRHMENIGYDVSTTEARTAIHADHTWVRAARTGSSRAMRAGLGTLALAFLVGFGRLIWDLISIGAQVTLKAKGGG